MLLWYVANGAATKSLAKRLKIYNGPQHPHAAHKSNKIGRTFIIRLIISKNIYEY